jgi:hypothetical protein
MALETIGLPDCMFLFSQGSCDILSCQRSQKKSKILDYSYSRPVIKLKPSLNMKMFTWLDRLGVDLKLGAHYLCKECTSTVRFTFSCKEDESVEVDMVAMATPTA